MNHARSPLPADARFADARPPSPRPNALRLRTFRRGALCVLGAAAFLTACGASQTSGSDAEAEALRTVAQASPPAETVDEETPDAGAPRSTEPRTIEIGEHRDTFTALSPTDDRGRAVHAWRIHAPAGELLRIRMSSSRVDPWLRVRLPDGRVLENDDFGGSTNSRLHVALAQAGWVEIETTTYAPNELGEFVLDVQPIRFDKIETLSDDADDAFLLSPPGGDPDGLGMPIAVHANGGERLRLRVTSPAFDTVVTLISPEGHVWENDDANDTGPDGTESPLDSTIQAVAPVTGTYLLYVRSYGGNGGPFLVRSERSPAPIVAAGEEIPRTGYAGVNARGRVRGVFVGITAYASSPLPGCADDARFLGGAFRKRRLAAGDDVRILLDAEATVENTRAAIGSVLASANEDDVFFFFFSGHGATLPATGEGIPELNGLDETIELVDGALLDHDFAALFEGARVGLSVVALDSCHAGGFARDFVDRPGRVGIFSSDEDVLSMTAGEIGAGGYLSWALLRGVLGAADRRPADGALLLGEFTDYLVDAYSELHADINRATARHQRLVVQRGAEDWGNLLWMQPRDADGALPLGIDDPIHGVISATLRGPCGESGCGPRKDAPARARCSARPAPIVP